MRIAKLYDQVSADYHDFNFNDIFSQTNQTAIDNMEIADVFATKKDTLCYPMKMIDLGVGDGRFLEFFHEKYPHVELTGVDISSKMLAIAQQKLQFQPINTSIQQISDFLPHEAFNLATANFVCAYVGVEKVLLQAKNILKSGGFISLTTSTFESFPIIQQKIKQFSKSRHPIKYLIGSKLQKSISATLCPINLQHIKDIAEPLGFTVKISRKLVNSIHFANHQQFLDNAFCSGFIVTVLDQSRLPSKLLHSIGKLLVRKTFKFPIDDQWVVEVVLLQKN